MAKYKLDIVPEIDFDLIGISCHQPDYKLCWHLNQKVNFKLEKLNDVSLSIQNKTSRHSYFMFDDVENYMIIELFKNKGNSQILIPDYPSLDYFLKLENNTQYNLDDLIKQIKELDCILTAVKLEPEEMKFVENLIF